MHRRQRRRKCSAFFFELCVCVCLNADFPAINKARRIEDSSVGISNGFTRFLRALFVLVSGASHTKTFDPWPHAQQSDQGKFAQCAQCAQCARKSSSLRCSPGITEFVGPRILNDSPGMAEHVNHCNGSLSAAQKRRGADIRRLFAWLHANNTWNNTEFLLFLRARAFRRTE